MENIADEFRKQYENYDIISKIGNDTWQIRLKSYDKIAVLKQVDNPHIYKRLMPIKIKGIPIIYNIFEKEGKNYVIEEYINGSNLSEILSSKGSINKREVKNIILRLCDILSEIHSEDIIHRDIKPSNIVYTSQKEVYLIDFGIARTTNEKSSRDTRLLGTEFYASPEQYGFAQTDCRSDIYSLGKLMIALLTGKENGEDINKIPYHKIILKCTQVDASKRYENVSNLKKSLQAYPIVLGTVIVILFVILILSVIIHSSDSTSNNNGNAKPTLSLSVSETKDELSQAEILENESKEINSETSSVLESIPTTSKENQTAAVKSPSGQKSTVVPSTQSQSSKSQSGKSSGANTQNNSNAESSSNKNNIIKRQATTSAQAQKKDTSNVVQIECLGGRPPYCKPGLFDIMQYGLLDVSDEFNQEEKHLVEYLTLSVYIDIEVPVYTEWNGNEFIITIDDKNTLKIPEPVNVEAPNYKAGMNVDKYYGVYYHDFDADTILDIILIEAVYSYSGNEYLPLYYVSTFVKVNSDLTTQILSNEHPIITGTNLKDVHIVMNDSMVGYELPENRIVRYDIKDNKVYCEDWYNK